VLVETRVAGATLVLFAPVPRQRHEVGVASQDPPQPPRQLVSVHLRHADVEQEQVGIEIGGELERHRTAVRDLGVVAEEEAQDLAQGVGGVLVVVDDEHPQPLRRLVIPAPRPRSFLRHGSLRQRQPHREGAAEPEPGALGGDGAPVQLHQRPHQRQADADPRLPAHTGGSLHEEVEDAVQSVARDSDPVVGEADHRFAGIGGQRHPDLPARIGVLGGIVEEVREDLRQAHPVRLDPVLLVRQGHLQRLLARLDQRPRGFHAIGQRAPHRQPFPPQLDTAAADARDVQEVFDQPGELADLPRQRQLLDHGVRVSSEGVRHHQRRAVGESRWRQAVERSHDLVRRPPRIPTQSATDPDPKPHLLRAQREERRCPLTARAIGELSGR
jgi:hypothetical protein